MARQVKSLPPSKRQYVRTFPALLLAKQIPNAKPAPFPGFIDPCLATLHQRSPSGAGWVHEIKYDGKHPGYGMSFHAVLCDHVADALQSIAGAQS